MGASNWEAQTLDILRSPKVLNKDWEQKVFYDPAHQIYFDTAKPDPEILQEMDIEKGYLEQEARERRNLIKRFPQVDIESKTPRLMGADGNAIWAHHDTHKKNFLQSAIFHVMLIASYFLVQKVMTLMQRDDKVYEVVFGIQNVNPPIQASLSPNQGAREATKTISNLTQMANNVAPDLSIKESTLKDPHTLVKPDKKSDFKAPKIKEKKNKNVAASPAHHAKKVETKVLKNKKQKIALKEFLKRKEEDLRKIGEKKQTGLHTKVKENTKGTPQKNEKLPQSPFLTTDQSIPKNPLGDAKPPLPYGSLDGKSLIAFQSYKLYVRNQIKKNWQTFVGIYDPNAMLNSKVSIKVDHKGKLVGEPEVLSSTGNRSFQQDIQKCLNQTFPVTKFAPDNLPDPMTFVVVFSSQDIQ